jgi:CRP-like cAMP-binding protein
VENLWLANLPAADRDALRPHLVEKTLEPGQQLFDTGDDVTDVWFPLSGVVSLMTVLPDARMVETGAVGREGILGVICGPLNSRAPNRAVCQIEGRALTCSSQAFSDVLDRSPAMSSALARFTESLFAQIQQTAACNAQHRLDERLARWLLMIHDRVDTDRVELTQLDIAEMLGVRRATVSEVGTDLEDRHLITRGRGWIEVLDRDALEAASCGCYSTIRQVMSDLDVPVPTRMPKPDKAA